MLKMEGGVAATWAIAAILVTFGGPASTAAMAAEPLFWSKKEAAGIAEKRGMVRRRQFRIAIETSRGKQQIDRPDAEIDGVTH